MVTGSLGMHIVCGRFQLQFPSLEMLTTQVYGHAFCEKHCMQASKLGYPAELKAFYKHCGVSKVNINSGMQQLL